MELKGSKKGIQKSPPKSKAIKLQKQTDIAGSVFEIERVVRSFNARNITLSIAIKKYGLKFSLIGFIINKTPKKPAIISIQFVKVTFSLK